MTFKVGDKVRWTSSNTLKTGKVTHVVPAGKKPSLFGVFDAGGGGLPRDHETYIIRGKKQNSRGESYGSAANYWPLVSLLERVE